ncbi:MBL fold metallo-hydrolase [Sphingobacterium sp. UT-1RO-CII-1]|uniref:MBL fold metallo-hydrolase n=1 Tax=Sphingobacterium sp. UT-1RO-CII-1 TaxID=2995225 RepID=UPI00227CD447|nr:MBL fold metallo-hydrolase [Sphingobacterium sp. UT-1RO-CII-1]MCY4780529.1 MBL fold metallo-hydrolase [Sphingobacterium sp. UT-1RO-CII-1]
MKVRLIRNATLLITINEQTLLIDPMLGHRGALGKFPWIDDIRENPLTNLPFDDYELQRIIEQTDAVLLTHLHPDHWDPKAQEIIPKNIPIYCQPEDALVVEQVGFKNVISVEKKIDFNGIEIFKTDGKHGLGEIGELMGKVSGYILRYKKESLYITGDTIWCEDVINTIDEFKPTFIIVNGGGAKFNIGEHVTMNTSDVGKLLEYYPNKIAIVHLETVSPALESRQDIVKFLSDNNITDKVIIPNDGEEFMNK